LLWGILGIVKKHAVQCVGEIRQVLKNSETFYKTEILGLYTPVEGGYWVGGHFPVGNLSGGYHGILKRWWDMTELNGKVLLIGESGDSGNAVKNRLLETYPKITKVVTTDLENADINWDISAEPRDLANTSTT
jgi:hypothetical protein